MRKIFLLSVCVAGLVTLPAVADEHDDHRFSRGCWGCDGGIWRDSKEWKKDRRKAWREHEKDRREADREWEKAKREAWREEQKARAEWLRERDKANREAAREWYKGRYRD